MFNKAQIIKNNEICIQYNCFVIGNILMYREDEESKFGKIGKIYFKEKANFYNSVNNDNIKYEGDEDFETALINFLTGEELI